MPEPHVYRPYQSTSGPHDGHTITFANIELWQDELPDALDIGGHLWVRERTCTMELWPEWEQVLFANVTDEVAQDNLNECVHELLDKAATVGGSDVSALRAKVKAQGDYIDKLRGEYKALDEQMERRCAEYRDENAKLRELVRDLERARIALCDEYPDRLGVDCEKCPANAICDTDPAGRTRELGVVVD